MAAFIPRISRDYPPMAASGGLQLHRPAGYWPVDLGALLLVRARFVLGERRVRDSNPRGLSPALAVFKTAAIGH
jgi:hypothetical protein